VINTLLAKDYAFGFGLFRVYIGAELKRFLSSNLLTYSDQLLKPRSACRKKKQIICIPKACIEDIRDVTTHSRVSEELQ
jgi:hypothetical protein